MNNIPKVSTSNTKAEIISVYNQLVDALKKKENKDPKFEKENQVKEQQVKEVSDWNPESIVKNLTEIKLGITGSLEKVEESLLAEYKKLEKLQQVVAIEHNYLEDVYQIKVNADSLAALIMANQKKEEEFEKKMEETELTFERNMIAKKQIWEKEQRERQFTWKEEEENWKKSKKREEEEYNYNLKISRKKEQDEYIINKEKMESELRRKKEQLEKEWEERTQRIEEKEKGLEEMKQKIDAFPGVLENAVHEAKKATEEQLTLKYRFETELASKEALSELKILKHTILSLENKVKEQEALINLLNEKSTLAGQQVQSIALKALESSTSRYSNGEKSLISEKN